MFRAILFYMCLFIASWCLSVGIAQADLEGLTGNYSHPTAEERKKIEEERMITIPYALVKQTSESLGKMVEMVKERQKKVQELKEQLCQLEMKITNMEKASQSYFDLDLDKFILYEVGEDQYGISNDFSNYTYIDAKTRD
jgi:hypothetical protein